MNIFGNLVNAGIVIWKYKDQNITINDICQKLKEVSIQKGDVVMIHADAGVFGKIGEIKNRKIFYNTIINIILSVLGRDGALIIPSYTYSICRNQKFDVRNTKAFIGTISDVAFERYKDYLKNDYGYPVIRSEDPIFSCIGFGKKAELILNNLGNECFGENSVFDRLYKNNAKLLCFGFPFAVTYTHYVERVFHSKKPLKYRYDKDFKGVVVDEDGSEREVLYKYYVRDLKSCGYYFAVIPERLRWKGLLKTAMLGGGKITLSTAKDFYKTVYEMLEEDDSSLLNETGKAILKGEKIDANKIMDIL